MTDRKRIVFGGVYTSLVLVGAAIITVLVTLPDVSELGGEWPEATAYMRVRVAEARSDGQDLRVRYSPVPLARIPSSVQRSIRVAEDAAFYQHDGFDWFELRQAVSEAWQEGETPRGASTITQQLARNLYLSPKRSLLRKLREALIAERLEAELSKSRILELYLNVIEFGSGVFGVDAAARHYFGIPVTGVDQYQAAQLAATIPAPRRQNPSTDTRGFRWRTELVYRRAFGQADTTAAVGSPGSGDPDTTGTVGSPDGEAPDATAAGEAGSE